MICPGEHLLFASLMYKVQHRVGNSIVQRYSNDEGNKLFCLIYRKQMKFPCNPERLNSRVTDKN